MLRNAWIIPALPVASFVVILLLGKRFPYKGAEVGIVAVAASFALACVACIEWMARDASDRVGEEQLRPFVDRTLFTWFKSGDIKIEFGTHIDGLAVMLLFVVGFVSLGVHIYSTAYMAGDRRYTYFYAALSLFTASMMVMVTGANTLQLLLGWEGMGLCSFMLIGHWWEEKANSDAALKAFFTTRTGDIGLLVGMSITFWAAGGTFDIQKINEAALHGDASHLVLLMAGIAFLCAVIGKSAQFPLHPWLPDAMAGPTPVSALIHAATMVVAGVYLVSRLYGVFNAAFGILTTDLGINAVALIGGITIIIAAALAFVQNDIKKVLAYSTVSQLGYMVMALGCGAWTAGVFHLFTHAFFKANLFLGAGSVSHGGSHHSFDMKKDMGGLRKAMPVTHATFVIGSLALAGIFPLAGFWSKDEILVNAGHNGYVAFLAVGLVGAAMTAAYMARCVWLTFYGEPRGNAAHHHPHESPRAITGVLIALSVMSVSVGLLNAPGIDLFTRFTDNVVVLEAAEAAGVHHADFNGLLATGSFLVAVAALGAGWFFYERQAFRSLHGLTARNRAASAGFVLLENKYYLDTLETDIVAGSIKGPIARAANWINQNVIDGVVNGSAYVSAASARWVYKYIDQGVVDGIVNGSGAASEGSGQALRQIQTGKVQQYAALLFAGATILAGLFVVFI